MEWSGVWKERMDAPFLVAESVQKLHSPHQRLPSFLPCLHLPPSLPVAVANPFYLSLPMLASPQDRLPTVPSTTKYPLTAYQLVKTIGTGTFGRVYLARNSITGAVRAMKVLKKSDVVRLKQVEHVINEKQILHTIKSLHGPQGHPFIVNLLDSYKDHRCLFMLEEFVPGGEIFSHLRRYPLPLVL